MDVQTVRRVRKRCLKGLKQEERVIGAQRSEDEPAAHKQHFKNQLQLETVSF